mgnify:CR=1 FL=1
MYSLQITTLIKKINPGIVIDLNGNMHSLLKQPQLLLCSDAVDFGKKNKKIFSKKNMQSFIIAFAGDAKKLLEEKFFLDKEKIKIVKIITFFIFYFRVS